MRPCWSRAAVSILLVGMAVAGGAGTEARAQYSRRTPIVEAVEKTRSAIVTVSVEKANPDGGRKEIVGTGVVVDERGYVITNCHVVTGAESVRVLFNNDTRLTATIITEDPLHDLAILRVKSDKALTSLAFGPSSDLMVGETVIAVGHPFGYTNSVSTGIVSAVGREITMPAGDTLRGLIQTDASINPGNSGGPLLNINGELIGINVAFREGAQGIAFALSADSVEQVLSRHLSASKVAGIRHGVRCTEKVEEAGKNRQKLVIAEVASETPAAFAGLKQGDTLIRVGARSVANRFDLERSLWDYKAGAKVEITVVREGRPKNLQLQIPASGNADVAKK